MKVTSAGINNGVIEEKYGKKGSEFNSFGMPTYSLPIKIEDAPANTVSFALVLEDKDAYPVTKGFTWIHWVAANITKDHIRENESQNAKDFIQGVNSWHSELGGNLSRGESSYYGGMAPPDAPHIYEIHVFALDKLLDLKDGFYLNELYKEMEGHIIDQDTLKGVYKN
ncbi:YbhB/YbcL family Raf kinase inhibitor-like protein [Clostridium sardiniense]|uniref:YbhB/YbcL family Raf kinase inhibitor-like protein n=1 Tax=Clostridium sardiniense TaxID=29369 RepID=A0ABS7KTS1_CLOSR|nr:YbhB/YbcL family Raf kinase inhibitor-like protein [Clostridium sardiniense]MBY0754012.1 YbhB/YbcL family Raf kinase inhibitor-like protein [Clostridium sardiniense]MDQ0459471.1 Raf kinase inhibitor-like YbhB/YbcL family protein [Clostridium sardiniense]